jgi:hypothetical protein
MDGCGFLVTFLLLSRNDRPYFKVHYFGMGREGRGILKKASEFAGYEDFQPHGVRENHR